jgi:putative Holliday junction resolvase
LTVVTDGRNPGTLLGVDYGARRIGVAISEGRIAIPLTIIEHTTRAGDIDAVAQLARERDVRAVVVGLPAMTLSGEEGEQARRARRFGDALARRLEAPVVYQDESYSSATAIGLAEAAATRGRAGKAKPRLDDLAAAVILQSHIDATERAS